MAGKKKMYLYNEEAPLTKYAMTQLRKGLKLNEVEMNEGPSVSNVKKENNEMLLHADFVAFPEEQLSNQQSSLNNSRINDSLDQFSIVTDDEVLNNEDSYEDIYSSDEEISNILKKKAGLADNTTNLLNEKKFFETISINVERSPAELLLMIFKYCISNRITTTGLTNLLKLVNFVCGTDVLPETRHKINQLCSGIHTITLHAVCPTCSNYMGIFENVVGFKICQNCNTSVDTSNPSNQCFFAIIDPSDAIRDIIEANESYYNYLVNERSHEKDQIKDIYDGQSYRNFVKSLNDDERHAYATLIFNTDGAPLFESSKRSIWPIYIALNEIPPQKRLKSVITTGLWCGLHKPEMTVFLNVFVDTMNDLSSTGIICNIQGEERRIKVYALLASVDSQARPAMSGLSQYNAKYGCHWCLHEGQYYAGSMRYPFKLPLARERDHASTINHAREAVNTNRRIFGIVTASPLLNLRKFDIIDGFTPDYLHCYLIGVIQQFTNYLLRYLTPTDIEYINKAFQNIRVPRQISRLARSLEHRGYWKAREYENWALYYSILVISSVFHNNTIIKHWSLLVDSLHICLGTNITYSQLNQVNEMLHKFVSQVEDIYSLAGLTYNVHQLLHVCKSIYNWGPLWTHSTFPFESANHKLLISIHCSKGVILQIARYEHIQRSTQILEQKIYPDCPTTVIDYCENLRVPLTKKAFKLTNITYIGKEQVMKHDIKRKFNISEKAKAYYKIIFGGCVFMDSRKENPRSCDNFAQLLDGRFVKLTHFIVDNNREITICKVIRTKPNYYSSVIRNVLNFTDEICIKTNQIWRICVLIEIEKNIFIIPLPNQLQY